ncbi:hypothetical protein [Streptomyces sp. NPDC058595]|uniref:hypothetical protein n=1 Tax=Streptomyces sp. NPDC058595 TaxID=3346550 RepID=UPI003658BFAD
MSRIPPPLRAARADTFHVHGLELPLCDWSYVLDEVNIVYGPGWYPFHMQIERTEQHPAAPLVVRSAPTGKTSPTAVRISPNVECRAWHNEYVTLRGYDHRVHAEMHLFVSRRGMGAMVRDVSVEVDLRREEVTVPDGCPPELRKQADIKGHRVLALLLTARQERREGVSVPTAVLSPSPPSNPRTDAAAVENVSNPATDEPPPTAEVSTVTVRKSGTRYVSEFSALPGQTFGPWAFAEMIRDLTISALLEPLAARDLVIDAALGGEATATTGNH